MPLDQHVDAGFERAFDDNGRALCACGAGHAPSFCPARPQAAVA